MKKEIENYSKRIQTGVSIITLGTVCLIVLGFFKEQENIIPIMKTFLVLASILYILAGVCYMMFDPSKLKTLIYDQVIYIIWVVLFALSTAFLGTAAIQLLVIFIIT